MNAKLSAPPSHGMPPVLATAPQLFRAIKSRGSRGAVDRTGGRFGAGLITKVSVITAGEAIGHDAWIDETFVEQARAALAAASGGIKSRWTHPDMSSDGLGKLTSRIFSPEKSRDGRQLYADQHFLNIGHRSPDGDLAGYLMDLAEEDPAAYGLSIVFHRDEAATDAFTLAHSSASGVFRSPDPANLHNFEHVRLKSLEAADAVDEPAANPAGLFSRKRDIARDAEELCAYAFGLRDEKPSAVHFGIDADRLRGFAARFLSSHCLQLSRKVAVVHDRVEAAAFLAAFGEQGAIWFADGVTWNEASERHSESLRSRIAAMEARLEAQSLVHGEVTPAGFTASDAPVTASDAPATRSGLANHLRFSP